MKLFDDVGFITFSFSCISLVILKSSWGSHLVDHLYRFGFSGHLTLFLVLSGVALLTMLVIMVLFLSKYHDYKDGKYDTKRYLPLISEPAYLLIKYLLSSFFASASAILVVGGDEDFKLLFGYGMLILGFLLIIFAGVILVRQR